MRNLLILVALVFGLSAQAQNEGFSLGGRTNTALLGTNVGYVIIAGDAGIPCVSYLSATSDKATSRVTFYTTSNPVTVTDTNATTTNAVCFGSGFSANDQVIYRHAGTTPISYERLYIQSSSATNVAFQSALSTTSGPGDQIYKATAIPYGIPLGATTLTISTPCYYGTRGSDGRVLPTLITANGDTNCVFNYLSGQFLK